MSVILRKEIRFHDLNKVLRVFNPGEFITIFLDPQYNQIVAYKNKVYFDIFKDEFSPIN